MKLPNPFQHRHAMKPVSSQHEMAAGALFASPRATTVILLRCQCGAIESKTINGSWTLGELRGEPHDDAGAVERLLKGGPA